MFFHQGSFKGAKENLSTIKKIWKSAGGLLANVDEKPTWMQTLAAQWDTGFNDIYLTNNNNLKKIQKTRSLWQINFGPKFELVRTKLVNVKLCCDVALCLFVYKAESSNQISIRKSEHPLSLPTPTSVQQSLSSKVYNCVWLNEHRLTSPFSSN